MLRSAPEVPDIWCPQARHLGVAAQADGLLQELDGLQVLLPQVVCLGEHEEPLRSLHPRPGKTAHRQHFVNDNARGSCRCTEMHADAMLSAANLHHSAELPADATRRCVTQHVCMACIEGSAIRLITPA